MIRFAYRAAALLALTAATPSFAQEVFNRQSAEDWRVSAISGEKPDRTVYLINAFSILKKGDTVTFETQSIFEHTTDTRLFDRSVTKRKGSCSSMSSRIVENSYYAAGAFQNTDGKPGDIIGHKAGTVMYDVLQQACGTKPLQAGTVATPETNVRNYFAK